MEKKIVFLFLMSLFIAACSDNGDDIGSEEALEEGQLVDEKMTVTDDNGEAGDTEALIGEHIIMTESSIKLPFNDLVAEAHFSEDGRVKLFVTRDMIIVIDDTEIVHVAMTDSANLFADPTVSTDGKYAIWRKNARHDDYSIVVFDVEKRTVDFVESTDKYDVYGVYLYSPLIEKVDNEYYLVMNNYLFGSDLEMTLNLTTKELYSSEYPEDQEVLSKLQQEPVFSGEETYMPIVEDWARQNNLQGVESSYYGYYEYLFEVDDLEEGKSIEQLYGVYSPEPKIIDLELDKYGINLTDENKEIHFKDDILIGDNGSFVFTPYEKNAAEDYKMFTYYIDLASSPVEPALVHESEYDGDKKNIFFNHDESGIYISEEGKLNFIDWN